MAATKKPYKLPGNKTGMLYWGSGKKPNHEEGSLLSWNPNFKLMCCEGKRLFRGTIVDIFLTTQLMCICNSFTLT